MFTGIIQETGTVAKIVAGPNSIRLVVDAATAARKLKKGDSVAVNGCCLTVINLDRGKARVGLSFDLLRETWNQTNLRFAQPGSHVNLELPVQAGARMDGHFVTGHIDGTGKVAAVERVGADYLVDIAASPDVMRYVVRKGSIAVDGISLTVASVKGRQFRVCIIPHTYAVTALREREVGDAVNLEVDIFGKYVERFIQNPRAR